MSTKDFERLVEGVRQMVAAKLADSKRLPGVVTQPESPRPKKKP